ncbi:hypothetical protein [Sphingomonas sp. OTU376]|uniref:hypothetical protein n=1 Tax=Sphingomonas sp. OTU376 TaxID=3043863 RepID=UPI00313A9925
MDFRTLFRSPQVRAIYLSSSPLLAFGAGQLPLIGGSYRNAIGDSTLGFRIEGDHYKLSGGAWPETVALIPVAGRADGFVFQQSDGMGTAFYGALRLQRWEPGFALFSPEKLPRDALRAARRNGAVQQAAGCVFATPAALLSALVPLAFGAPERCWDVYHPA